MHTCIGNSFRNSLTGHSPLFSNPENDISTPEYPAQKLSGQPQNNSFITYVQLILFFVDEILRHASVRHPFFIPPKLSNPHTLKILNGTSTSYSSVLLCPCHTINVRHLGSPRRSRAGPEQVLVQS